ncbi:MAG TPA: IS110 family transposase [Chromatiaceae bacterium]|nr:IS110 family transposase [Chromatiaceae bacterium]
MRIMYERCAALDVHKKTVVACVRITDKNDVVETEVRTFGTTTPDLLQMADWLNEWKVTIVAMESTGEYWKPVFNLLEGNVEVILVNARHVKQVPGRKTDVKDSEWLAELLSYGLLKASFIPPKPQRDLRDLTRYRRNLVQERSRVVNRLQKVLEHANIKLASVASDVMGVSGRQMMEALVQGESDPKLMAGLAKGRLRNKMEELVKALTGVVGSHHRFMLAQHLAHIDFLDEQVATVNSEIGARVEAMSRPPENDSETLSNAPQGKETRSEQLTWAESIEILDTAPGVDVKAAQMVLAETGIDMSQFPNEDHLTSWAGLAPGNNQSGSKRKNAKTREGNRNLREVMIQIAWAASRTKGSYTRALYRRLAARRGKKRAIVAVARSLLVSFYHMLTRKEAYHNLGEDYFDKRRRVAKVDILTKQLQKLGYDVRLEPLAPQVTLA